MKAPTMLGTMIACAVCSAIVQVVTGGPWIMFPFRLVVACVVGAMICWGWQRLARS